MDVRRHTQAISLLITVLLFSAVVPCGLLEVGDDPLCAVEDVRANASEDDGQGADLDADCCAGCLVCCASVTEPHVFAEEAPPGAFASHLTHPVQPPRGSPFSIWRPPRA